MNNKSENKTAPSYYARCYNKQCTKADSCLRHIAVLHTPTGTSFVNVVNPDCLPADTTACPHYQSAEKIRMAWGITHLLDKVPFKDGQNMRNVLIGHFGKSQYYRFYRHERPLRPEDQAYIRQFFRRKGITEEPVFDSYTDEYDW